MQHRRRHLRLGRDADRAGTTSTSTRSRSPWPQAVVERRARRRGARGGAAPRPTRSIWGRSRDHQQSATVADLFTEAGLEHDPELLAPLPRVLGAAHRDRPAGRAAVADAARARHQGRRAVQHDLAARVARATSSPRRRPRPDRRRRLHQRDPVDQALARGLPRGDGRGRARATRRAASTSATGSSTTSGAPRTPACRAIHIPHSVIPAEQVGHTEGEPDAVAHELAEIPRTARPPLSSQPALDRLTSA